MAGLTLNPDQRVQLARRLGFADPWSMTVEDVNKRMAQLRDRVDRAERSFADSDPSGILRLAPMPPPKTTSTATATLGEADVDAAVGDGRISPSERPVWLKRFADGEDFAREVLNALPPDPVRGETTCSRSRRSMRIGR